MSREVSHLSSRVRKTESSSASSEEDWYRNLEKLSSCGSEIGTTHAQSHSEGMCDVVCGQVVRSVRDQVDSGIDR